MKGRLPSIPRKLSGRSFWNRGVGLAVLVLAALLAGPPVAGFFGKEPSPESRPGPVARAGGSEERSSTAPPLPASRPAFDAPEFYVSEAFHQVPAWLPRPAEALAVETENVSLRSDGKQEGTIRFTLAAGPAEAMGWGKLALTSAGLQASPSDPAHFSSSSTPRRCGLAVEELSSGVSRVTLTYDSTEDGAGCFCRTCQGLISSDSTPP